MFLFICFKVDDRRRCPGTLRGGLVSCNWRRGLLDPRELSADENAARRPQACFDDWVLESAAALAPVGHCGWSYLVYGSNCKLCSFTSTCSRTCSIVFDWPESDYDFSLLGRLCVARVSGGVLQIESVSDLDVCFLSLWDDCDRRCATFFCKHNRCDDVNLKGVKMSGQKPIVVVGSINTDLVAVTRRIPAIGETITGTGFQIHPGGKGANQAAAVARLGYPVRLVGRLGNDLFGRELRAHLSHAGVDIAGVATSEGTLGVAVILVSHQGENSIVVTPGANSEVAPGDLAANIEIIRSAGIVLV